MKLKYKIILFEDDKTYAESLETLLKDALKDLGFELTLIIKTNGQKLAQVITDEDIDLVLVDLNLDSGKTGGRIIERLRAGKFYKEVIFYSDQKEEFDKMVKKMGPIEGIYYQEGRRDLFKKIMKIIEITLKKIQDISNLRGLVIAETIDLEAKMDKLILKYFDLNEDEKIDIFKLQILGPEFFTATKKIGLINKVCKEKIKKLNEKYQRMTNGPKRRKLKERVDAFTNLNKEFKKIEDEIIKIRNTLAHVKESATEKNILRSILKDYKEIKIDYEWCKTMRKNLVKHSENLDKIKEHL
jgi:CheY-like chemotaxis protein